MIGLIGHQDDAIGFGLTGIQHIQEVTPAANEQEVREAFAKISDEVQVIIIPASLREHLPESNHMIIEIPQDNSSKQEEISALAKELLGVNI